jgi:hypothetical protein
MAKWLKGCEVCDAGLTEEMNEQIDKGLTQRAASKELVKQQEKELGMVLYTENAIRQRYRYHTGKKEPGQIDPPKKKKLKMPPVSRAVGETVTIEIMKSIADDFLALAKKGAYGSGWKGMDLNSLTEKFIFNKVQSGRRKLKKMAEKEYVKNQLEGIERVKKEIEEAEKERAEKSQ